MVLALRKRSFADPARSTGHSLMTRCTSTTEDVNDQIPLIGQSTHLISPSSGRTTERNSIIHRRMKGITDGKSILALWREIAWHPAGSPRKDFKLRYQDFVEAEELLVDAIRTELF